MEHGIHLCARSLPQVRSARVRCCSRSQHASLQFCTRLFFPEPFAARTIAPAIRLRRSSQPLKGTETFAAIQSPLHDQQSKLR